MINLKVRFKNPVFYLQILAVVISSILAYKGITASEITSWDKLWEIICQSISNPYMLFLIAVNIYNSLIDPTTKGIGDSKRALTYDEPSS